MKTINKPNIYFAVILVLIAAFLFLAWNYQKDFKSERARLKIEIQARERIIDSVALQNTQLKTEIELKERGVAVLRVKIDSTKHELTKKQKALNYYARQFKTLTNNDRDSILRAYIRANQ